MLELSRTLAQVAGRARGKSRSKALASFSALARSKMRPHRGSWATPGRWCRFRSRSWKESSKRSSFSSRSSPSEASKELLKWMAKGAGELDGGEKRPGRRANRLESELKRLGNTSKRASSKRFFRHRRPAGSSGNSATAANSK